MENKPKNKTISVIVSEEMRADLDRIAVQEERNLSWIVRKALQNYIDGQQVCEVKEN